MKDRRGEVWEELWKEERLTFVVVGPPTLDEEGDVEHPCLVLDSTFEEPGHLTIQWEFKYLMEWESDEQMRRLA